MEENKKIRIDPITGGIVIVIGVLVVLLIITIMNLLRTNPYGKEIRIDNMDSYYGDMSQDEKDIIFHDLYETVASSMKNESDIPESGAMVRKDTAVNNYNKKTDVHYGNFVVDIEEIKYSYEVQFEWSNKKDNENLSGYRVLITCVPDSLKIYDSNLVCIDYFSSSITWDNEYQIDYSFGATTARKIYNMIESALSEKGVSTISVDETSLKKIRDESTPAYSFKLKTDAGDYDVLAKTDDMYGEYYIAVLIKGNNFAVGYVSSKDENNKNIASEWLKVRAGNPELTIVNN